MKAMARTYHKTFNKSTELYLPNILDKIRITCEKSIHDEYGKTNTWILESWTP